MRFGRDGGKKERLEKSTREKTLLLQCYSDLLYQHDNNISYWFTHN